MDEIPEISCHLLRSDQGLSTRFTLFKKQKASQRIFGSTTGPHPHRPPSIRDSHEIEEWIRGGRSSAGSESTLKSMNKFHIGLYGAQLSLPRLDLAFSRIDSFVSCKLKFFFWGGGGWDYEMYSTSKSIVATFKRVRTELKTLGLDPVVPGDVKVAMFQPRWMWSVMDFGSMRSAVRGAVGGARLRQRVDGGAGGARPQFDHRVPRPVRAGARPRHLHLQQRHLERHPALRTRYSNHPHHPTH